MKQVNNVVWDWNGTLINDIEACMEAINRLLDNRGLPRIEKEKYKELFTFPIINYYKALGFDFDKEPFDVPAMEYIKHYNEIFPTCQLANNAREVLHHFHEKGYQQYILSAMEHANLEKSVKYYGIQDFFESIQGIKDHFAAGKEDAGQLLMKKYRLIADKTVMIGDTVHDHEVAGSLGIDCILIADGHQSKQRLEATGRKVLDEVSGLIRL